MLSAKLFGQMSAGFNQVVDTLGVPAEYHQTKPPQTVTAIATVGFKTPSSSDEAIINTIGIGGRIVTIKAADLSTPPVKLDRVKIKDEMFTVETVHVIQLGSVVLGWKLLCKGR